MQLNLSLGVVDLDHSEKFYRDLLRLQVERHFSAAPREAFLLVICANVKLLLQPFAVLEMQHPALLQNLTRTAPGVGMKLEFSCPDLDSILQNLAKHQWPIIYELDDQEHQRREIWLQDPDGYVIVLNEEP